MTTITAHDEILKLEERLRQAELGPDPAFFQEYLDDKAVMVSGGEATFTKQKVVDAHQPGAAPKFINVTMSDMQIIDHQNGAVVTCKGSYETSMGTHNLKFMRVWVKKPEGWRIVAGTIS
ncbi:MAG: nuclear transport factor 2 family protein [Cyanobacteria bacterium TGS_CYA1]|nr:nuclear transport factor 2 family protein [Cyanobacteria bacterium TGS_CYA1]